MTWVEVTLISPHMVEPEIWINLDRGTTMTRAKVNKGAKPYTIVRFEEGQTVHVVETPIDILIKVGAEE